MVAERKYVNADDKPDLRAAAHEVQQSQQPIVLLIAGKEVAVIEPVVGWKPGQPREFSDEELAAFKATGGGWIGIVDVDQFQKDNNESRWFPSRPPVEL